MAKLPLTSLFLFQTILAQGSDLPAVTHYKWDVQFHLKEQRITAVATLSVKNATKNSITELPFLLYRLLNVEQIRNHAGQPFIFTQKVVQLDDEPSLQATAVTVDLPSPLQPNDSITVIIKYNGFIFGYPEVMAYVRDRIDENYSLLRPDTYAYPLLAKPTFASTLAAYATRFTYEVSATVPRGYRVACGGELVDTRASADSSTFLFCSKVATWRIDIAVAEFSILSKPDDRLIVYYLLPDSVGAQKVLAASRNVVRLYSEMFGRPKGYRGYTIIEIPDGWGSQASDFYFLQTAAAFNDTSRISEVYHEVGHSWNATPSPDVQRCRYFDEAFASYFASLAIRAFRGETAFEDDMEHSRSLFTRWAEEDREVFETPISSYGTKELGRHSYTKGAWSLYVLHRLVGDKSFYAIIHNMMTDLSGSTIDFRQFQRLCERVSRKSLDKFFQEWIYGSESSRLLVDRISIAEIVKRY